MYLERFVHFGSIISCPGGIRLLDRWHLWSHDSRNVTVLGQIIITSSTEEVLSSKMCLSLLHRKPGKFSKFGMERQTRTVIYYRMLLLNFGKNQVSGIVKRIR